MPTRTSGSLRSLSDYVAMVDRFGIHPGLRRNNIGFRLAFSNACCWQMMDLHGCPSSP